SELPRPRIRKPADRRFPRVFDVSRIAGHAGCRRRRLLRSARPLADARSREDVSGIAMTDDRSWLFPVTPISDERFSVSEVTRAGHAIMPPRPSAGMLSVSNITTLRTLQ